MRINGSVCRQKSTVGVQLLVPIRSNYSITLLPELSPNLRQKHSRNGGAQWALHNGCVQKGFTNHLIADTVAMTRPGAACSIRYSPPVVAGIQHIAILILKRGMCIADHAALGECAGTGALKEGAAQTRSTVVDKARVRDHHLS